MAKIKGQLESAQLENLTTDPTNLPEGRTWVDTTNSKAKVVIGAAKRAVVTEDQTQTLTNKTLSGSNNTFTNIPSNTAMTGILPKVNGGSGQDNSSLTFPSTGTLATTAGAEVLTNKDIDGGTASNTSRIAVPKNTLTNLTALTRKAGAVLFDTTSSTLYYDNGSILRPVSSGGAPAVPTVQKFTSGSGTYTTPVGVQYIRVRMVGGGGGGGAGTSGGAASTAGGNTTFGASLLVANGGSGGIYNGIGGAGGTASLGTGPIGLSYTGARGQAATTIANASGGQGGSSFFGGAGAGSFSNTTGGAAETNSGSGGGGAGNGAASVSGSGGGAGGFVDAIIVSPLASYSYAVGAGGTGQTGSPSGGAGAAGIIIVEEYYQ